MEDVVLIELGAGMAGVLGVPPSLGKLLALEGDGCTPDDEPKPFKVVADVEFPNPGEYDGADPVLVTRGMLVLIASLYAHSNTTTTVFNSRQQSGMNRCVVLEDYFLDQKALDRTTSTPQQ